MAFTLPMQLGTTVQFDANIKGDARVALPSGAAIRIYPHQVSSDGITRLAFGDATVKVPSYELPAFTVPNNRETVIIPPAGATYIAAQGVATVTVDGLAAQA